MVSRRSLLVGLVAAASLTPFGSRRVRGVAARTINKLIKPTDPFVRVGKTVPLETFRANVINEVYSGAGIPTATGFASSDLNTADPLIAYSLHPANLAQYDQHTQQIKDNSNNNVGEPIIVGVWRPCSGTKNNKLVIQMLGHLPLTSSLDPNDPDHQTNGNLVKLLVEGGYTVAVCEMPSHGDLDSHIPLPSPTASLNPLRYFTDRALIPMSSIAAIRAAAGSARF
jgi:hypothetical protein